MIRQALTTDLPVIAEIGEVFFQECSLPGKVNPAFFQNVFERLMLDDLAEVWVYESNKQIVGTIAIVFSRDHTTSDKIAQEMFWYVLPDHRMLGAKLLFWAMKRAKERGCDRLIMTAVKSSPTYSAVCDIYEKMGMKELETNFIWQSEVPQQQ